MEIVKSEVISLYTEYKSYTKVANLLGISRQRVHQIITGYTNSGRKHKRKELYDSVHTSFCEMCIKNSTVALHHKDGNNKNDIAENLINVCHSCHMNAHVELRKKLKIKYKKFYLNCKVCKCDFNQYSPQIEKGVCKLCWNYRKIWNERRKERQGFKL